MFTSDQYSRQRYETGAPVSADSADLTALININAIPPGGGAAADFRRRDIFDCAGWKTVRVLAVLGGGASPTADLIPLGLAQVPAEAGDTEVFTEIGAATGALANNESAEVQVNGEKVFMRISALTGNPTSVEVFIAGAEKMVGEPGQGRALSYTAAS